MEYTQIKQSTQILQMIDSRVPAVLERKKYFHLRKLLRKEWGWESQFGYCLHCLTY
jgi:hypothetical protein